MFEKAHLDFETFSAAPLKTIGLHKYAAHKSTGILCTGFAFDDECPEVSHRADLDWQLKEHVEKGGLVLAHNAPFELAIWNEVGVKKYGWPELRPAQVECTMARCYSMSLPGALENAAAALGLTVQKDMDGHRVMMKLSQPKGMIGEYAEWYTEEEEPELFEKLYRYCKMDITVEREIDKRTLKLSPHERKVWLVDFAINTRGVMVDLPAVESALTICASEEMRLNEEMRDATSNEVATINAHTQLKAFLLKRDIHTASTDKNDVARILRDNSIPPDVRRALETRREGGKASTKKLRAFLDRACADSRLRGLFQYGGASRTLRWAGRGPQPHNFPRSAMKTKDIEHVFAVLHELCPTEAHDYIQIIHGSAIGVMSNCLKSFLLAGHGKEFLSADFSSIESRVIAWLAGQESVLEVFRTHGKIYEAAAADIFNCAIEDIVNPSDERQSGKVAVLALGYQGGVAALQAMGEVYNVTFEPVLDSLWQKSPAERRRKAKWGWDNRGEKETEALGISKREWFACELIKLGWREKNPFIVQFWKDCEAAAIAAVATPGKKVDVGSVNFLVNGSFLWCKLPSGRHLCYPYPELREIETTWGEKRLSIRYMEEDERQHWSRAATYGGKLAENITQAVARDLLAAAMVRAEEKNFPIVLHVHDEAVAEVAEWRREGVDFAKILFERIMCQLPEWATGLPVKADAWRGKRYRKG